MFDELDSLLVETYQITPVLIDDSKLVTGEEGCLCTFDLEFVKDNNREGLFDPKKMPDKVKENIIQKLDEFHQIIRPKNRKMRKFSKRSFRSLDMI